MSDRNILQKYALLQTGGTIMQRVHRERGYNGGGGGGTKF